MYDKEPIKQHEQGRKYKQAKINHVWVEVGLSVGVEIDLPAHL